MTDIKSMNESELRKIVSDQSDAILRLIHHLVEKDNGISDLKEKLEAQETISEIQKMALDDKKTKGGFIMACVPRRQPTSAIW